MGNDADAAATADYDTDMQTIGNYVSAVVEAKAKIVTAYTAALDNAQMTFQTASPAEARPDILGVMLKSGLESAEKAAVTAVKEATGADLGPLVDMMNAISDEVDRAAKAAADRAVADWLTALRTSLVNAYTQGQTGEDLRQQIEGEYKNNDVGGRGGYIAGIENELTALGTVQVAADGSATSATVTAPLGDRVAGRLNSILANAKVWRLMDLDVVKKVCRDTDCMCFEGNNTVRKDVLDGDTHTFLTSPDNWKLFTSFTT
jgi:hypothetical protein